MSAAENITKWGFVKSWRKEIKSAEGASSALRMHSQARIEIWIAPVPSMIRGFDLLSADEIFEFNQIRVPSARDGAIAGRTLLRIALSHAVHGSIAPKDWRLRSSRTGKPKIAKGLPPLHFSVTHTERLAAVAVSEALPIGIDAETIEQMVASDVVTQFCCPGENAALQKLPSAQSTREFVRLWTLKEAYAKMTGLGSAIDFASLGFSFDSLDLAHKPAAPAEEFQTHFETMFVANGNSLSHISLAAGLPLSVATHADLQVITLASNAPNSAIHIPCVTTVTDPRRPRRRHDDIL